MCTLRQTRRNLKHPLDFIQFVRDLLKFTHNKIHIKNNFIPKIKHITYNVLACYVRTLVTAGIFMYGPAREKSCLGCLQPGKVQTSLFSPKRLARTM